MNAFLIPPESQGYTSTFKKVWIVDDDDVFQFILKESLKAIQISGARTFDDGRAAFEELGKALNESPHIMPDIIFLDAYMPVLNGFEFLTLCNKLPSEHIQKLPPIFLLSGETPSDNFKEHPLVKAFIKKSASFSEIKSHLAAVLSDYERDLETE